MKTKTRSKPPELASPPSPAIAAVVASPAASVNGGDMSKEERIALVLDLQKRYKETNGKQHRVNWKAAFAENPEIKARLGVTDDDAKSLKRFYAFANHLSKSGKKQTQNKNRNLPARRHTDVFASPISGHFFGGAGTPGVVSQAIFAASQEVMAATFEGLMKAQNALARLNQTTIMAAQVQHAG